MEFYMYRQLVLRRFWKYKQTPPTTWSLIKASWRLYLLCTLLIALQIQLFLSSEESEAAYISCLGIGTMLGFIAAGLGQARLGANMNWPVLEEVIDWNLVEDKCAAIEDNNKST